MAEYKDVETLKKQIADFKRAVNAVKSMNSDYLTGYISALSVIEGEIAEQPAADVAEVVRCKDCKYNGTIFCPTFNDNPNGKDWQALENDEYCSYGERKDG